MSGTRGHKHQQTIIYNEDQLRNAWYKFDQRIKEKEEKLYHKKSSKKLLGAQNDSVSEVFWLLKQQSAPEIETDAFDGNPMEFHYFMTVFK